MLVLVSAVTVSASMSVFLSLACLSVGISSSAVGLWNTLYKYGSYLSRRMYQRNGIETIVDNDGILRLNQTHMEELDRKSLREITRKHNLVHRKHRYKLVE